jgi:predicted transcriptional regulator
MIRKYSPIPTNIIGSLDFWVTAIGFGVVLLGSMFVIKSDQMKRWALKYSKSGKGAHRLSMEDVFANANRLAIIDLLSTSSGIHFNELRRQCKIGRGQLKWHLDILEEYGIIKSQKIKQYTVFFPTQKENSLEDNSNYNKISKTAQDITNSIKSNPGITTSEISRQLKLHRSSVKYHIDQMKIDKQIRVEKSGRKYKLYFD